MADLRKRLVKRGAYKSAGSPVFVKGTNYSFTEDQWRQIPDKHKVYFEDVPNDIKKVVAEVPPLKESEKVKDEEEEKEEEGKDTKKDKVKRNNG